MAGSITVSSITLDSDNNFSIRSNTGATILSANGTGLITGIANGASIVSAQLTTPTVSGNLSLDSTGTSGIRLPAANTLAFHTAGSEDMRIDSSGNVGIGATSLSDKLTIAHADEKGITFKATGTDGTTAAQLFFEDTNGGTGGVLRFDHDVNSFTFATAGTTERMRIDSSGRVTTPFQPRFKARLTTGNNNVSNGSLFPFTATIFDVGSNFNTSTYRFTAPIAGYYFFHIQIYRNSASQEQLAIRLNKNGGAVARCKIYAGTVSDSGINVSAIVLAASGDYFNVENETGATFPNAYDNGDGSYSYFDGTLLG